MIKKTHINMNYSVFRNINQTNKQTGTINFHGHTTNIPYSLHKMPRTIFFFFFYFETKVINLSFNTSQSTHTIHVPFACCYVPVVTLYLILLIYLSNFLIISFLSISYFLTRSSSKTSIP